MSEEENQIDIENIIHQATILTSPHDLKAVESTNNNEQERYQHPGVFDTEGLSVSNSGISKNEKSRRVRDVNQEHPFNFENPSQTGKDETRGRARETSSKLTAPVFIKSAPSPKKNIPNIALINQQLRNRIRPNVNKRKVY